MKCSVKQGKSYRAKIEVPFFKRPFANENIVRAQLTEAGFTNVHVKSEGGGVYWVWGMWPNPDATESVDYIERFDEL